MAEIFKIPFLTDLKISESVKKVNESLFTVKLNDLVQAFKNRKSVGAYTFYDADEDEGPEMLLRNKRADDSDIVMVEYIGMDRKVPKAFPVDSITAEGGQIVVNYKIGGYGHKSVPLSDVEDVHTMVRGRE